MNVLAVGLVVGIAKAFSGSALGYHGIQSRNRIQNHHVDLARDEDP